MMKELVEEVGKMGHGTHAGQSLVDWYLCKKEEKQDMVIETAGGKHELRIPEHLCSGCGRFVRRKGCRARRGGETRSKTGAKVCRGKSSAKEYLIVKTASFAQDARTGVGAEQRWTGVLYEDHSG